MNKILKYVVENIIHSPKKNGWKQLFFYLSNLDVIRFIEFTKTIEFLKGRSGLILELGCGYSVLPALLSDSCKCYVCLDIRRCV